MKPINTCLLAALMPAALWAAEPAATLTPMEFSVPEGWLTEEEAKARPTSVAKCEAEVKIEGKEVVKVPLFLGEKTDAVQTLNGREVAAFSISGGQGNSVYGLYDDSDGGPGNYNRDIWIKVTDGNYDRLVGGSATHWKGGTHASWVNGRLFTELGKDATANHVIGVYRRCGGCGMPNPAWTGKSMVVIDGLVNGAVVGGALSACGSVPRLNGDTAVLIRRVLDTSPLEDTGRDETPFRNWIIGGSSHYKEIKDNLHSGCTQTGDASVKVDLPDETPSASFERTLVGGSLIRSNGSYAITGSTSVTVSAPTSVTFTQPICGGSRVLSNGGEASITGNTSVTLNGGTYASEIAAGNVGTDWTVGGTSSLTLNGAMLKETATLLPYVNKSKPAGQETFLNIGERGADLSPVKTIGTFGTLSVGGDTVIGTHRFAETQLKATGEHTLTLTLTPEELKAGEALIATADAWPKALTVGITNPEAKAWVATAVNGLLKVQPYVAPATPDGSDYSEKAGEVLKQLATSVGAASVRVLNDRVNGSGRDENLAAALDLFSGIAAVSKAKESTEAEVRAVYDFGISRMKHVPGENGSGVLYLEAKVRSREEGLEADFADEKVAVEVTADGEVLADAVPATNDEVKRVFGTDAPTAGVRYMKMPLSAIGGRLGVRAVRK